MRLELVDKYLSDFEKIEVALPNLASLFFAGCFVLFIFSALQRTTIAVFGWSLKEKLKGVSRGSNGLSKNPGPCLWVSLFPLQPATSSNFFGCNQIQPEVSSTIDKQPLFKEPRKVGFSHQTTELTKTEVTRTFGWFVEWCFVLV